MLSVIIPCIEDDVFLPLTLKSIFSAVSPQQKFEVLVIYHNNKRPSNNAKKFSVREFYGPFKKAGEEINFGIRQADGDIICTTKPGCIVSRDWLIEIERFLNANPTVDGVGGPVFPCLEYGTKTQSLASHIFSEESNFPLSVTSLKAQKLPALFHATNNAYRKDVFDFVEYDNSFHYDYDWDISWQLLRTDRNLIFNPGMMVSYIFPSNLSSILRRYYHWGQDYTRLLKKHNVNGIKCLLFPFHYLVKSLIQPRPLISKKKVLKIVQHTSYIAGRIVN